MTDNLLPAPILPEFPPKAEFRKWLRSLPPDEVVAEEWHSRTCPLASWLLNTSQAEAPYVRPERPVIGVWRPDFNTRKLGPLPVWANKFGLEIDKLGGKKGHHNYFGPVTAADCLAVLRAIRGPRMSEPHEGALRRVA